MTDFLNALVMTFGIMFIIVYSIYFGLMYVYTRIDFIKNKWSKMFLFIAISAIAIPILTPILLAEKVLELIDFKEMNEIAKEELKNKK